MVFNLQDEKYVLWYLIPILFNIDSSTFWKAYTVPKSVRDNVKVILFIMRDERFNNESCYRSLASTHFNLYFQ